MKGKLTRRRSGRELGPPRNSRTCHWPQTSDRCCPSLTRKRNPNKRPSLSPQQDRGGVWNGLPPGRRAHASTVSLEGKLRPIKFQRPRLSARSPIPGFLCLVHGVDASAPGTPCVARTTGQPAGVTDAGYPEVVSQVTYFKPTYVSRTSKRCKTKERTGSPGVPSALGRLHDGICVCGCQTFKGQASALSERHQVQNERLPPGWIFNVDIYVTLSENEKLAALPEVILGSQAGRTGFPQ